MPQAKADNADVDNEIESIVREKADDQCEVCEDGGSDLDIYLTDPDSGFSISNLSLLCESCYQSEHNKQKLSTQDVMEYLEEINIPFLTSRDVADEFNVSTQTARRRLKELNEDGQLDWHEIDNKRTVYFKPDFKEGNQLLEGLREGIDLTDLNQESVKEFARQPYKILPRGDNEYFVVVPDFLNFSIGHLHDKTDAWRTYIVNRYVSWYSDLPDTIEDEITLHEKYQETKIDGQTLELADENERERVWEDFDGQDGPLQEREGDTKIKVQQGKEFEVIADLIDGGNLPFTPSPIAAEDIRPAPTEFTLREYQQEAWETFEEYGSVGIFWPMGLGKTWFAQYCGIRIKGKKLVVVPTSTLKQQWRDDIDEKAPNPDEWDIQTYQYLTHSDENLNEYQGEDAPALTVYDECLSGDTEIITENGRTTFSELETDLDLEGDGWKRDVQFQVKTFDPETGEHYWTEVEGVYKTKSETIAITTNTGQEITTTEDHPHIVFNSKTGDIETTQKIEEGDMLVQPSPTQSPTKTTDHTEEELLGWVIGDGHVTDYNHIKWSFAKKANEQITIIESLVSNYDCDYTVYKNERGDTNLYAPKLAEKLPYDIPSGDKANTVRVPSNAYNWSSEKKAALLRGLFDAEGNVTIHDRIEFNTTSEGLANDVSRLLVSMGYTIQESTHQQRKEKHSTIYRLKIPAAQANQYQESIGFRMGHKSTQVERTPNPPNTALEVSDLLSNIKTKLNLTENELAEMAGVSRGTINGVLQTDHRISQSALHTLSEGLEKWAQQPTVRTNYNITYDELGDQMGCSISHAYNLAAEQENKRYEEGVNSLINRRKQIAKRYADKLAKLKHLNILRVKSITSESKQPVYDLETASHTFLANGFYTHNCHYIPADTFSQLAMIDTTYRIGVSASPYREDDRTEFIFALTGMPVGMNWNNLVKYGNVEYPDVHVYLYRTQRQKRQDLYDMASQKPGKGLIFCDSKDRGNEISDELNIPFVSGDTPPDKRMDIIDQNNRVVASRVADEGMSLPDLNWSIEHDFQGSSSRQELQRLGRVMHGDDTSPDDETPTSESPTIGSNGLHIVQMTDDEMEKFGDRLQALQEKGINTQLERRA